MEELLFSNYVSCWEDEKVLVIDGDEAWTTTLMYLMSLNRTIKKLKCLILCTLYHNLKNKAIYKFGY